MSDGARLDRTQLAAAFWGAVLLSVILAWIPGGRYALYPFELLGTWAHEMGHGLAALTLGGSFERLELRADLGGTAYHRGASGLLAGPSVAAAGLLGPALAGGLIIVLGARPKAAPAVLAALGAALLASLALWVRNPFGMGATGVLGGACLLLAGWAPLSLRVVVTQLTGIQLCVASLGTFDYLFTSTFERDGRTMTSDTQAIADHLLLPYWVWGGLIFALSLLILGGAFWAAWMRDERRR